jgi:serine/threonine protein kinase
MLVYNERRQALRLGDIIGRGGEASVYSVQNYPDRLAKIYHGKLRPDYPQKLAWMRDHPPVDPTLAEGHASLAWPMELLYTGNGQLCGYLMPFIRKAALLLEVFNPRLRARFSSEFNRRYLHRAARNLAVALGALHNKGYIVGDLNESNILVTPTALVTLIDTDSFQVQEPGRLRPKVYGCPVAKLEYTPPELQGVSLDQITRVPQHDAFGLGVLIFQLLMEGSHPFRAQWLGSGDPPPIEERIRLGCFPYMSNPPLPVSPPVLAPPILNLHPELVEQFMRCFVDGQSSPQLRPSPQTWARALETSEQSLIRCKQGHVYSGHLRSCPECREAGRASHGNRARKGVANSERGGGASRQPSQQPVPVYGAPPPLTAPAFSPLSPGWASGPRWQRFSFLSKLRVANSQEIIQVDQFNSGLNWYLIWALSGACAAAFPGIKFGRFSGGLINHTIGWPLWIKVVGAVTGLSAGILFGWILFLHSPLTALLALFGMVAGWYFGGEIWPAGVRLGWQRLWTTALTALFAWSGWHSGAWLSGTWLGLGAGELAGKLSIWVSGQGASLPLNLAIIGLLGGAMSGAIIGATFEVLGRLLVKQ